MVQCWQIAMSIMMCTHSLRIPWLPVTCPFFNPSFLNGSIYISVTVKRLCVLLRKWKSSIWPLYLTSGFVLRCVGLPTDGAVASFDAILPLFFNNFKVFTSRLNNFNIQYSVHSIAEICINISGLKPGCLFLALHCMKCVKCTHMHTAAPCLLLWHKTVLWQGQMRR